MKITEVELSRLQPPVTRPLADPNKVLRMGAFDWDKFTPIIVECDGRRLILQDGMTRVEVARRAGIKKLPAYVFSVSDGE